MKKRKEKGKRKEGMMKLVDETEWLTESEMFGPTKVILKGMCSVRVLGSLSQHEC